MVADEDLKPFGWAPGGYVIHCIDCPSDTPFIRRGQGDKRSRRCRPCAIEALKREVSDPPISRSGFMEAVV